MDKIVEHWVERSQYDLDTAKAMLDTGRYLYVAYMCQQTIEKILKALIAQEGKENFPIHNLNHLPFLPHLLFLRKCRKDSIRKDASSFSFVKTQELSPEIKPGPGPGLRTIFLPSICPTLAQQGQQVWTPLLTGQKLRSGTWMKSPRGNIMCRCSGTNQQRRQV